MTWMARSKGPRRPRPFSIQDDDFVKGLNRFVNAVRTDINDINEQTQFDEALFEPLEAEVEVEAGRRGQREVRELISAIRSDVTSPTFLVLGEPGSGKSVALRKLTLDLLAGAPRSGRLPVYIDLKEWRAEPAARQTLAQSIYDFVVGQLSNRYDMLVSKFVVQYFEQLYSQGHLFFVLDSFDEIPAIMDAAENSERLREISKAVFAFVQAPGEVQQSVIASRYFKKPVRAGHIVTTLDIRPFTEPKIRSALERTERFPAAILEELFQKRLDLVALAQNPLSAGMLAHYVDGHKKLPQLRADLFSATINERVSAAAAYLGHAGMTVPDLIAGAETIAYGMFATKNVGLDATAADLAGIDMAGLDTDRVIHVLVYLKIGRYSQGPERRFSFVHRRFNEYFLVRRLIQYPESASLVAIPTDNRWRDTLTLYCEVASEAEARRIADYCWERVRPLGGPAPLHDAEQRAAVQCLRFLRDAFSNRSSAIAHLQDGLAALILSTLSAALADKGRGGSGVFDIVLVKFLVEAVGLLPPDKVKAALQRAFLLDHAWISETALRSCRGLQRIEPGIESSLARMLIEIPTGELVRRYAELSFSFNVSEAFAGLRNLLADRYRGVRRLQATMPFLWMFAPVVTMLAIVSARWTHAQAALAKMRGDAVRSHASWELDEEWAFRSAFVSLASNLSALMVLGAFVPLAVVAIFTFGDASSIATTLHAEALGIGMVSTTVTVAPVAGALAYYHPLPPDRTETLIAWSPVIWLVVLGVAHFCVMPGYVVRSRALLAGGPSLTLRGKVVATMWWLCKAGAKAAAIVVAMFAAGAAYAVLDRVLGALALWTFIKGGIAYLATPFAFLGTLLGALGFLVFIAALGVFAWEQVKAVREFLRDRSRFRNAKLAGSVTREEIARDFKAFKSERYRRLFMQKLINDHPDVSGEWPGRLIPATVNDAASKMLLKWDERLRGLD